MQRLHKGNSTNGCKVTKGKLFLKMQGYKRKTLLRHILNAKLEKGNKTYKTMCGIEMDVIHRNYNLQKGNIIS